MVVVSMFCCFTHKTAYEMRISDWSSDVFSSDLLVDAHRDEIQIAVVDHLARTYPLDRHGHLRQPVELAGGLDAKRAGPLVGRHENCREAVAAPIDVDGGYDDRCRLVDRQVHLQGEVVELGQVGRSHV